MIQFAEDVDGTVLVSEGELVIQGDLSIEAPGAEELIFVGGVGNRVFKIKTGVRAGLSGMTITGGLADSGGAIYNTGVLEITDSTLSGNSAEKLGGAIFSSGTVTITGSTLSQNSATGEDSHGGGISNSGTMTLIDSTLSDNSAEDGGAIYNRQGELTIVNSTLADNSAVRSGGGVYNVDELSVINSTLSNNSAGKSGGGFFNCRSLSVTNSTVTRNWAGDDGGGIYVDDGASAAVLNNTIVAENIASSRPDVDDSAGILAGSHNLIGDGTDQSTLVDGEDGNQVGTSDSPIDPLLSEWTELDNGRWGHHLLPGSPALDAGDNALAVDANGQPLNEDYSGGERIQNDTVDIGALEGAAAGDPAQTYVVTSLDMTVAEDGVLTFLEALEAANRNQPVGDAPAGSFSEPDMIQFAGGLSGTVFVNNGELVIEGNVYIEGPGAEELAFDGGGSNRVFTIKRGVSAELSGMTITGGSAENGGGIYSYGVLTVSDVTLSENSAISGGGIYSSGTLAVTNSTLSGNTATTDMEDDGNGGGIYSSGTLTVTNSTLSKNSADSYGGGIYSIATMTVANTVLSENSSSDGGGIYSSGTLAVTASTLSENSATGGGGIYNCGTLTLTNSTLWGNSATNGGGIYSRGTLTVTNSTLSRNSAMGTRYEGYGGGIYALGTLTVTNSTLSENLADEGGGIYGRNSSSTATLNNTLIAGNFAHFGPDIHWVMLSGSHNLIGDGSGQWLLVDGENGNQVGNPLSPLDPLLSNWTELDNGRWGYYLLPGSPALDAGENSLALNAVGQPLVEDISGGPRIQDGTVDIGAVEGVAPGDPAQTYIVASLDMTVAEDGVLTFLEAFEAANRNQPVGDAPAGSFTEVDVIRFAEGLSGTVLVEDGELVIRNDLSIEGPGAGLLAFDAGGTSRVFQVEWGITANLSGMTITGGLADIGGGIYSDHGMLTVAHSTISANSAGSGGGGIYSSGTLTVTDSTLSKNSTGRIVESGTLTAVKSTLSEKCPPSYGGGIFNDAGTLTVTNCTLSENSASVGGGIHNSGTATVTNSTLWGNEATSGGSGAGGGGISSFGTLTVTNCTLFGNSATAYYGGGGGIYNYSGTLTVNNSAISDNRAEGGGGICSYGTMTVTSSTLSGNSARYEGGGIYHSSGKAALNNTLIAGNSAGSGRDICDDSGRLSGSHNLIGNGKGQTLLVNGVDGNLVGTPEVPIDPRLVRLPSHGGDGWGDDPDTPDVDESANDDRGGPPPPPRFPGRQRRRQRTPPSRHPRSRRRRQHDRTHPLRPQRQSPRDGKLRQYWGV